MPKGKKLQKDAADKQKSGNSSYKTRNWVTVLYPDSAKEGWRDMLRGWCCQAFVSPLHDRDANPDGEQKKPHWHLLVMMDGPKAHSLMEKRFAELGGVGCQPCNSARGYARYLCHLDNPEKAQYSVDQVEAFGGADYLEVIALESDRRKTIAEMMDWCLENRCTSFRQLCDFARANNENWFRALTSNSTMIMYRYLRSLEHELEREQREADSRERRKLAVENGKRVHQKAELAREKAHSLEDGFARGPASADWEPCREQCGGTPEEIFG